MEFILTHHSIKHRGTMKKAFMVETTSSLDLSHRAGSTTPAVPCHPAETNSTTCVILIPRNNRKMKIYLFFSEYFTTPKASGCGLILKAWIIKFPAHFTAFNNPHAVRFRAFGACLSLLFVSIQSQRDGFLEYTAVRSVKSIPYVMQKNNQDLTKEN